MMTYKMRNSWQQPKVPNEIVVENIADIATALDLADASSQLRFWSPPAGASIHGVLWFVALQKAARDRYPECQPIIVLDCGDRADLAHAALREGMSAIAFRGSAGMLAKLQQIAETTGALVETRHPSLDNWHTTGGPVGVAPAGRS